MPSYDLWCADRGLLLNGAVMHAYAFDPRSSNVENVLGITKRYDTFLLFEQ